MKKLDYCFVGTVKDLLKDLNCEIESRFDKEIEEGFRDNNFCDSYGYCSGSSCKNYYKCRIVGGE